MGVLVGWMYGRVGDGWMVGQMVDGWMANKSDFER